jgi:predicted transcriptional regulator
MSDGIGGVALVLGIASAAIGAYHYKKGKYEMAYVESTVDNKKYLVRNMKDKEEAANRMAKIRSKLLRLMKHLEQTYKDRPFVKQIVKNFDANPERFTESTPDASYTSYSVNKGEKIFMCLRQRDEEENLVDDNILVFVALHEMSHIGTSSIGHTKEFWNHFAWLLEKAEKLDIYTYQDFAAHPVEYCGVFITDSPKYKQNIEDGTHPE